MIEKNFRRIRRYNKLLAVQCFCQLKQTLYDPEKKSGYQPQLILKSIFIFGKIPGHVRNKIHRIFNKHDNSENYLSNVAKSIIKKGA